MEEAFLKIKPKSILSKKIFTSDSNVHGKGMFAKEKIVAGETVCIKGGYILKRSEMYSDKVIDSYLPISDDLCVASPSKYEEEQIKLYFNHSCDPNCGMHGEITFIAIRDISAGEELTIDYAFVDNEDYSFKCHCGSKNCRHVVTGRDWRISELQKKYYPYFAQYLKDKISG